MRAMADDDYSDEAITRRRDEFMRRMLKTSPQPRTKKATGAKVGRPEKVTRPDEAK